MARQLVIVESPAKARTLGRFLGRDYAVRASLGHVRDLPAKGLAVDTARGFTVEYEVIARRRRLVNELRTAARDAETIFLAADPDREGEAICWHLAEVLGGAPLRYRRVTFHEITQHAVDEAFRAPRAIDARRVEAQQARRILDRLVGYSLSPLLWREVKGGLSAGRVQSVALRLVCERERAIQSFVAEEYWTVRARLDAGAPPVFPATLVAIGPQDATLRTADAAAAVKRDLERASFRVLSLADRQRRRAPAPPFVTSTLQQEAFRKLRFGVKKTMQLAQALYEGVELGEAGPVGLITYMRTDSVHVAQEAATAARVYVARVFGPEYVPEQPPAFRSGRAAQEAHEAIRPTDLARTPDALAAALGKDAQLLYRLIFDRFVASQMAAAVHDETTVDVEARPPGNESGPAQYRLRAKGSTLRFRGFLAGHEETAEEKRRDAVAARDADLEHSPLPALAPGQTLALQGLDTEQKFTEPPRRFSEASLVKELERCGIGRPSTYASILATLLDRDYVRKEKAHLEPTPLGFVVTDLLVARFPELLSVRYTASMEDGLDAIEAGRATLLGTLDPFWRRLQRQLAAARRAETKGPGRASSEPRTAGGAADLAGEESRPATLAEDQGLGQCPKCGRFLERREGRYGAFVGCSGFPRCRHIQKKTTTAAGVACPLCHSGEVVERTAQERRFFGCSRYPDCRFTSSHKPLAESCPECGQAFLFEKETKRDGRVVFCGNEACHHHR